MWLRPNPHPIVVAALALVAFGDRPAADTAAAKAPAPAAAIATAARSFDLNGHTIELQERHDRAAASISARVTLNGTTIFPDRSTSRDAARRGFYGPFQPPSKQFMVFAYAAGADSQLILLRFDGAYAIVGGRAGAFDPFEKTFVHDPGFGARGISVLDLGTLVDTQANHDVENLQGWFWRRGMLHLLTCRPDDTKQEDCSVLFALKPERPRDTGRRVALCPWEKRAGTGRVDRYTGYATATPESRVFAELDSL